MNILLISPLGFPVNPETRYAGIEKLVWEYSKELTEQGHSVTVMGHEKSVFPERVTLLVCPKEEIHAYQSYQYLIRNFDVVHDFSHMHLASRFMPNLPSLNIFWHAPSLEKYPKAPYNIIALSKWASREFKRIYHQEAKYQQSIVINPDVYKPKGKRGDRFLAIGRMSPEKGNINALLFCRKAGVPMDRLGGRGQEVLKETPLSEYEMAIVNGCDDDDYKLLGEVTDEEKIKLMQSCKALIYATDHPEVTNHKLQEVLFCGAPVIAPRIGAQPEIVTQGVDGFLCRTEAEYLEAINNIDKLTPSVTRKDLLRRFSIKPVVKDYLKLYEEVANGLIWK